MRRLIAILVVIAVMASVAMISCGDSKTASTEADANVAASPTHDVSAEMQQKLSDDLKSDFAVIGTVRGDVTGLAEVMTGAALTDLEAEVAADQAAGKYKVRDYQNIAVTINGYTAPVAQVLVDFDNHSYYIDAASGKALGPPADEHVTLAVSLRDEDGRWKISGIYMPESNQATVPAQ